MALCGADRSTFHTAHQPQSPSWQPLEQEKEWFGINSAGAFPCPAQWEGQGHHGQGLLGLARTSATATAWPARQRKAPGSFSSPLFKTINCLIANGNSDTEVVPDTNLLRSAGFPLWLYVYIYILVWAVHVFTWGQRLPMGTQILREVSCNLRSSTSKFLSKSRWVLWDPHFHLHHLSSILCMLLGMGRAITISPDLSCSI